ncbi:MAG: hypothetical protein BroJett003_03400 [Planctomycetota bacterium]|nr:MAG: hypothetical protein BroJett003_03400 [Planctomycetota bacterium]
MKPAPPVTSIVDMPDPASEGHRAGGIRPSVPTRVLVVRLYHSAARATPARCNPGSACYNWRKGACDARPFYPSFKVDVIEAGHNAGSRGAARASGRRA